MVDPFPGRPYSFRALAKTFGRMWVRCDSCRRYAPFRIGGLQDADYRTKSFSCSSCGGVASLCVIEPVKETGMADYRLDERKDPPRHANAVVRLTGQRVRTSQPRKEFGAPKPTR